MKYSLLVFLLTAPVFAQKTFFVKDSTTNEPVAYTAVFIENGLFKINAEENGSFSIPNEFVNETFVFDAIGYEQKQQALTDIILLEPKSELLDEVVIVPRLGTKEVKIGKIHEKREVSLHFSEKNKGILHATKFTIEDKDCRFIKEISIRTKSKIKNAKFALKIYSSNENGEPDELIHDVPIIAFAKKGKHTTVVNIEDLKLHIYSESFFVVFDQLYLEENSYYEDWEDGKFKAYEPKILLNTSNESTVWIYSTKEKTWRKVTFDTDPDYHKEKYFNFQMEITLTN